MSPATRKKKSSSTSSKRRPAPKSKAAPAKKSAAKKSPAKKSPAKKSPAKKSPAKKSPAKKSAPARKAPGASPLKGATATAVEVARQLAGLAEEHALAEVSVKTGELEVTIRRGESAFGPSQAPVAMAAPAAREAQPASALEAAAEPEGHVVTSPFVGTFYRSPSPDSDPYVELGKRIEKGQILCIVEAMKLMNEIEADMTGVISEILVSNSDPVEYGQALFRISPA